MQHVTAQVSRATMISRTKVLRYRPEKGDNIIVVTGYSAPTSRKPICPKAVQRPKNQRTGCCGSRRRSQRIYLRCPCKNGHVLRRADAKGTCRTATICDSHVFCSARSPLHFQARRSIRRRAARDSDPPACPNRRRRP
jgi:hypothetical protein